MRMKKKVVRTYYKFDAKLYFDQASQNIFLTDANPRYYIKPGAKPSEVMEWSPNANSLDYGFFKDSETNFYLRDLAVPEYEVLIRYSTMVNSPPFGYDDEKEYSEYARQTFNAVQQSRWAEEYEKQLLAGKEIIESTTLSYVPMEMEYTELRSIDIGFDELENPDCTIDGLKVRSLQTN